jgi:hypothetical protein
MIRTAILAVAALIALSLYAEASQQHRVVQPICDNMGCDAAQRLPADVSLWGYYPAAPPSPISRIPFGDKD